MRVTAAVVLNVNAPLVAEIAPLPIMAPDAVRPTVPVVVIAAISIAEPSVIRMFPEPVVRSKLVALTVPVSPNVTAPFDAEVSMVTAPAAILPLSVTAPDAVTCNFPSTDVVPKSTALAALI